MKHPFLILLAYVFLLNSISAQIPAGFGYIADEIPDIVLEIRYAGKENFMGRIVNGYTSSKAVLTKEALSALKKAQAEFNQLGYCIKLFDAYRPQKAVNHFIRWSKIKEDTINKNLYYPEIKKNSLFELGFIAKKSGHSRGSTIDLTLVYLEGNRKGKEVDMGSKWDFFGDISNYNYSHLSKKQKYYRKLLRETLLSSGFIPYEKEWWHFTLKKEPFPKTYFNFIVP